MKTKYIGLEGYGEIEAISDKNSKNKKKRAGKLNTAQKTIRFIKRAVSLGRKHFRNKKNTKPAAKTAKAVRIERSAKPQSSVLERQYLQSRTAAQTSTGAMESLKVSDPLKWVGLMNNFKNAAEEIVLRELVYS